MRLNFPESRSSAVAVLPGEDAVVLSWPAAAALAGALLAYLLPGVLGHTPWKQDEAYSFGIILHMIDSGQLLVPVNAGQPFLEKPPLYYWTAALFGLLFRGMLPLHDAARLASVFYTVVAMVFVVRFARAASGAARDGDPRVLTVLALYLGAAGMVRHVHDLFTDVALCAGAAIGLYGLQRLVSADARRRDALWLGLGVGVAALSKGLFVPAVFATTCALLPLWLPACRTRRYLYGLGLAALVALPLAASWPLMLAWQVPDLFGVWFWQNNVGRFAGFSVPTLGAGATPGRIPEAILGFAFPTGPLALLWLLRGGWRECRQAGVAVSALFALTGLTVLQASATSRHLYLLPFMAPLAVLGAHGLAGLPARGLILTRKGLRLAFFALAVLVWGVYLLSLSPGERAMLMPLAAWLPMDFTMPFQLWVAVFALVLSHAWLWLRRDLVPVPALALALEWLGGMMLVWGLTFSLLLPWIEAAKGYQQVFQQMNTALAGQWRADDCMASLDLGESEAPMLHYFSGILHRPVGRPGLAGNCRWLLAETRGAPMLPPTGWRLFWQGARDGDPVEHLMLFAR